MEIQEYGVCRLSVIPVRKGPTHTSEQVTQLLFGDDYRIIGSNQDVTWYQIEVTADRYQGWIDVKQHHPISQEYFDYLRHAEFKITTDVTSSILYNKSPFMILLGSIIPISSSELFKMEEQFAFNGDSKNLGQKRGFDFLQTVARKYLYAPYQWGGKTPFGIDCSGLVQMVFKICGYELPRDSWQQATQGKPVENISQVLPGDLAFFSNHEGKIIHTGIVLNDQKIIHASGLVRIDQLDERGIFDQDKQGYTHQLSHFRRILSAKV